VLRDSVLRIKSQVAGVARVFRDPAWCFALVGLTVAVTLSFVVPTFGGIDEGGHFMRSYQIAGGTLVPHKSPLPSFDASGACVPDELALKAEAYNFLHYLGNSPAKISPGARPRSAAPPSQADVKKAERLLRPALEKALVHCGAPDSGTTFYEFTSFAWYSPVPYLPAAAGVAIGRAFGWGATGLDRAARLVQLLVVLFAFFVAIRRAPWARWVFAAAALLPITLFSSATVTPDAMTTAAAFLVVSSALRMTKVRGSTPAVLGEALFFGLLLGLCKPTYWVVAFVYLIPLFAWSGSKAGVGVGASGLRRWRDARWLLLVPIAASVGVSELWHTVQRHLFICDVRYFNIVADPPKQVHELLTAPWNFVGRVGQMLPTQGPRWLRQMAGADASMTGTWPMVVVVLVLIGFLALAYQRAPGEDAPELPRSRRIALGVLVVAALLLMSAGLAIFCSAPGSFFYFFFGARFLVALIPLALLAAYPPSRWASWSRHARVPPALALVPFYAVFLTVTVRTVY
jgi:hypothetical protein